MANDNGPIPYSAEEFVRACRDLKTVEEVANRFGRPPHWVHLLAGSMRKKGIPIRYFGPSTKRLNKEKLVAICKGEIQ